MRFNIGETVSGVVKYFSGKGAAISLLDGSLTFLSPKNLSWKLKNQDAADYFNIKDSILVKILSEKISDKGYIKYEIGFRELYENPWTNIKDVVCIGEVSLALVTQVIQIGIIFRLPSGFEALVHNTQVSWDKYNWKSALPKVGDIKEVLIIDVDKQRERISASIKQIKPSPIGEIATGYSSNIVYSANVRSVSSFGLFVLLPNSAIGLLH